MNNRYFLDYCADFETTVYNEQKSTEVWAYALSPVGNINPDKVSVGTSIQSFFDYICYLKNNLNIYFHNLKFDGMFILHWLKRRKYKDVTGKTKKEKELKNNEYFYCITSKGQWFYIICKIKDKIIRFYDSAKILPLSVEAIGKAFKTKAQKLSIEYEGKRKAGGKITKKEELYVKNDVLVVSEALAIARQEGINKMTLPSSAVDEMKERTGLQFIDYKQELPLSGDRSITGKKTPLCLDDYIRQAYAGGWCYVNPKIAGKKQKNGKTFDVNSLYPFVMHSKSGRKYPVGEPTFWENEIPKEMITGEKIGFVRIECGFNLKKDKLPFVHIRNTIMFRGKDNLTSSCVHGKMIKVKLMFTYDEFIMFLKHYNTYDMKILDGCCFDWEIGLFDKYIDVHMLGKINNTGGKRQCHKLFLNSPYGKLATSPDISYKKGVLDDDGLIKWEIVDDNSGKVIDIAKGAFVTSYARIHTISAAQANYKIFCYSDTDSIHLTGDGKNIKKHDSELGAWKCEGEWEEGIFVRQKTYIEICENEIVLKGAGMGKGAKNNIEKLVSGGWDISNFRIGFKIGGNLKQRQIPGGVVLCESDYEIRK